MNKDPTIKEIKKEIEFSNENLLEELTKRFLIDIQANMLFFVFNFVCSQIDFNSDDSDTKSDKKHSQKFFDTWLTETKKRIKNEMSDINKKLNDKDMSYLGAISSFSLPSTEDYQKVYNDAFKNVKTLFDKATI
jgi:hypothetical protein